MGINEILLYAIILSCGIMAYFVYAAHKEQKRLLGDLKGVKERLNKLNALLVDVEKVEHEMHKAAVEKVDKRNLELIMKETLEFINEKGAAQA
ncbi:MAG: hypothetical protein ABIG96_04640 [Candidatus Micrarchaeota archaeon]